MNYTKDDIKSLVELYKKKSKDEIYINKKDEILNSLKGLKDTIESFNDQEMEFLQTFYVEFSDGDPRTSKILTLGERYEHAEYFFINKFFDNNFSNFYTNFVFKNTLYNNKNSFMNLSNVCVKDVLKNEDKDVVSLYIFIENVAKHFNDFCKDREKKDKFKVKLISLYNLLYTLFYATNEKLLRNYFPLILHNQPLMVIEFVKECLGADSFEKINHLFNEETRLNSYLKDEENFACIDDEFFNELVSLIAMENENLRSCIYSKKSVDLLGVLFNKEIKNFEDFKEICKKFIDEYKPFLSDNAKDEEKYIYASLFFCFISQFEQETSGKNIIFYGSIGTGKTQKILEFINLKKLREDQFRFVSFHKNYKYEDVMDGFVNSNFVNGDFKQLCIDAMKNEKDEYYYFVDNINGVDIDEVFGEALELMHQRFDKNNPTSYIRTKNSHIIDTFEKVQREKFSVFTNKSYSYFTIPKNVFIIASIKGNMGFNKISPALIDCFEWKRLDCNYNLIISYLSEKGIKNAQAYAKLCKLLNNYLVNDLKLGQYCELGHNIYIRIEKYNPNGVITETQLSEFFDSYLEPIIRSIAKNNQEVEQDISRYIKISKDIFKF